MFGMKTLHLRPTKQTNNTGKNCDINDGQFKNKGIISKKSTKECCSKQISDDKNLLNLLILDARGLPITT